LKEKYFAVKCQLFIAQNEKYFPGLSLKIASGWKGKLQKGKRTLDARDGQELMSERKKIYRKAKLSLRKEIP
jgi:hypothetical protein